MDYVDVLMSSELVARCYDGVPSSAFETRIFQTLQEVNERYNGDAPADQITRFIVYNDRPFGSAPLQT